MGFLEEQGSYGTTHHTGSGFAGRRASTTTVITKPVFLVVGVIGMSGTPGIFKDDDNLPDADPCSG